MTSKFIEPMLAVSTSHITAAIAEELDSCLRARDGDESIVFHDHVVYPHGGYGYQIHVSEEREDDEKSPFAKLIALARSLSCCWILLDRDAEVHPDLPVCI